MGPNELDAEEGPELRALREREQRGGRLSEAERRRFAELLDDQIKAVVTAGRLAASASVVKSIGALSQFSASGSNVTGATFLAAAGPIVSR